jgi:proteasome activator subunit 4
MHSTIADAHDLPRSWLLMRYPMHKAVRARLVRVYYELCLLPGIEARVTRNWADMLTRLIDDKPGARRKLETADVSLPWAPLWRALQRELWPKKRAQDGSRNVLNILLYVAEHCRRYFPAEEIGPMLDTFLPLVTQDVGLRHVLLPNRNLIRSTPSPS